MWTVKLFFVSGCIAFAAAVVEDDLLDVSAGFNISLVPAGTQYSSLLGVIANFKSCGGPGVVLSWRYDGCKTLGYTGLCQLVADGKSHPSDFTFVPSASIPGGLGARFIVSSDGVTLMTYEFAIRNSAVRAGQVYTVRTAGNVEKELVGKIMTFHYAIFRQVDHSLEACAVEDFEII